MLSSSMVSGRLAQLRALGLTFFIFFSCLSLVLANVEKTIFKGPPVISIPLEHPNLDDLCLISLNPQHLSARTWLNGSFPSSTAPKGTSSWMLLENLSPRVRYEVRICWLATEPRAFDLQTHSLTEVFETPELISSLSTYAHAQRVRSSDDYIRALSARRPQISSGRDRYEDALLFLQIWTAADYFTTNKALMAQVPPILVDIILDPYLLNIFPQSLLRTAVYIILIAVFGWFLSGFLWQGLLQVVDAGKSTGSVPISGAISIKKKA